MGNASISKTSSAEPSKGQRRGETISKENKTTAISRRGNKTSENETKSNTDNNTNKT